MGRPDPAEQRRRLASDEVDFVPDCACFRPDASPERMDLVTLITEQAGYLAADEPRRPGNDHPHGDQPSCNDGTATAKRAPQARASSSWPMISSFRFHGRIRMISGRSARRWGSPTIGIWLPGNSLPIFAGLRS